MISLFRRAKHPAWEMLSRRLDGELEVAVQSGVDQHLKFCAPCRKTYSALQQVHQALQALPSIESESAPLRPAPIFVPIRPAPFARWGVPIGTAAALAAAAWLVFRPQPLPMRLVAGPPPLAASRTADGSKLPADATVQTLEREFVDLEIPGRLMVRLKPGSALTWQEVAPTGLGQSGHIVVNLMRGEMLARTAEGFWGRRLEIKTPTATARIQGTAFSVDVDPAAATTVRVLAGKVFFSPHAEGVGVHVAAGQRSERPVDRLPQPPQPLSRQERLELLDAFEIGETPPVALVIGAGPERLEEIFGDLLIHVRKQEDSGLFRALARATGQLNQAMLDGDPGRERDQLDLLERILKPIADPELAAPLHLYVGALAHRLGQPQRAFGHFVWVADNYDDHPLAPLALAASARLLGQRPGGVMSAQELCEQILKRYPASPESQLAKKRLLRS